MANVLIVDDTGSVELHTLLTENGWGVHTSGAKGAVAAVRASTPEVIAVLSLGSASARFVAHLQQHLSAACPPVLVALSERNDALRDQCLIAGASDVTFEGNLDDVATKLDLLANGWFRGTRSAPLVGLVRAQRGKQNLTLQAADIDPSGLGLVASGDLVAGELIRAALALPGGSLVVWGRVSESDGALGVRFVGLASEDRVRLAGAIKGSSDRSVPSRPTQAIVPPTMTPSASHALTTPVGPESTAVPEPVVELPTNDGSESTPPEPTTGLAGNGESLIDGLIGSSLSDGERSPSPDAPVTGEGQGDERYLPVRRH